MMRGFLLSALLLAACGGGHGESADESAAEGSGSPAYVSVYGYFFGPEAEAAAEEAAARWSAWLVGRFPPEG